MARHPTQVDFASLDAAQRRATADAATMGIRQPSDIAPHDGPSAGEFPADGMRQMINYRNAVVQGRTTSPQFDPPKTFTDDFRRSAYAATKALLARVPWLK